MYECIFNLHAATAAHSPLLLQLLLHLLLHLLLLLLLLLFACRKDRETITLPLQWLWDMLDEFVYQFQESSRWLQRKCKTLADSPDRKRLIAELEG